MINVRVKTSIEYNGIPSVVKNIHSESAQAAYDLAREVAADARRRAPVRTGFLKGSIVNEKIGEQHHAVIVGAPYGAFVEYGTRFMPAQPFLRPAIEAHKEQFKRQMLKVIHR